MGCRCQTKKVDLKCECKKSNAAFCSIHAHLGSCCFTVLPGSSVRILAEGKSSRGFERFWCTFTLEKSKLVKRWFPAKRTHSFMIKQFAGSEIAQNVVKPCQKLWVPPLLSPGSTRFKQLCASKPPPCWVQHADAVECDRKLFYSSKIIVICHLVTRSRQLFSWVSC